MSFRKSWLPNLFFFLLGPLIFKPTWQPWMENLIGLPRDRLLRVVGYSIGLSVLLLGLLRARMISPWIKNLGQVVHQRLALLARRSMDLTPAEFPVGTPSATAAAIQPSPVPPFVNTTNSPWMLEDFAQRQRAALLASGVDPSMWRNAALLDSPRN
jgi:hypothetical protein